LQKIAIIIIIWSRCFSVFLYRRHSIDLECECNAKPNYKSYLMVVWSVEDDVDCLTFTTDLVTYLVNSLQFQVQRFLKNGVLYSTLQIINQFVNTISYFMTLLKTTAPNLQDSPGDISVWIWIGPGDCCNICGGRDVELIPCIDCCSANKQQQMHMKGIHHKQNRINKM